MPNLNSARTMAFASGLLFAVLIGPRVARACALPSDCTQLAPVCELGVCHGCLTNYTDGGLDDLGLACQDPSFPICEPSDGSVGGQCVAAPPDGGGSDGSTESDAGTADAGEHDAGHEETDAGDASSAGDASEATDGSSPTDATAPGDGATEDASREDSGPEEDGSSSDGSADGATSANDASTTDAAAGGDGGGGAEDGGPPADDSYLEGGGCSCDAVRDRASLESGFFALAALGALGARRRRGQ